MLCSLSHCCYLLPAVSPLLLFAPCSASVCFCLLLLLFCFFLAASIPCSASVSASVSLSVFPYSASVSSVPAPPPISCVLSARHGPLMLCVPTVAFVIVVECSFEHFDGLRSASGCSMIGPGCSGLLLAASLLLATNKLLERSEQTFFDHMKETRTSDYSYTFGENPK